MAMTMQHAKYLSVMCLCLASSVAVAGKNSTVPMTASGDLLMWCEQESKAALLAKGAKPYNWTASHWDDADSLYVKGSWRNGTKEIWVECHVGRGMSKSYASMSLQDQ